MSKENLSDKLKQSEAYSSLRMERDIANITANIGWKVDSGVFYPDVTENKPREIDMVASQMWRRRVKVGEQILRLSLLVECKSLKGWNIIILPRKKPDSYVSVHMQWIGHDVGLSGNQVKNRLAGLGYESNKAKGLFLEMYKNAYPTDFAKIKGLQISPMQCPFHSSAFRETNVKGDKDLDSSVLWRANRQLLSAVSSLKVKSRDCDLGWIFDGHEYEKDVKKSEEMMLEMFDGRSNMVDIWHPIVVLDAAIWRMCKNQLRRCEWFRFGEIEVSADDSWWCDVVEKAAYKKYLFNLTKSYVGKCRQARLKRLRT